MTAVLASYNDLSSSSSRSIVSTVLQSIINAPPLEFDKTSRSKLIQSILRDLQAAGPGSRLELQDAAQALLAVKTLGRNPTGSESLATAATLSTLLSFTTKFGEQTDAASEALRCIANTLLLFDHARTTFMDAQVGGGEVCLNLLDKSTSPAQIFIVSRILFLSTASGPSIIISFVEDKREGRTVVDIISEKLLILLECILSGANMAHEAIVDLLKFTFNLLLHYPKMVASEPQNPGAEETEHKVIGDAWNSNLDGLLPPLLHVFYSLPPTSPCPLVAPLTHVVHSLITIPVNTTLSSVWFGPRRNKIYSSDISSSPVSTAKAPSDSDETLVSSVTSSPPPQLSGDILLRAHELLETVFSHYFPGSIEPDDPLVRSRAKKESLDGDLDDICSPLVVLITRICLADKESRLRIREWIIPSNLDRSSPLEQRADLLGRCLRLLSSVYHPRLKDSVGEMLFAICDSNAYILSSLVGYGNVAGFLFNKGVMSSPPPPSSDSDVGIDVAAPDGRTINPITGNTMARPEAPNMTDEEKEAEAEKLFVLFDRLERSGVIPKEQNPVRKAIEKSQQS